MNPDYRFPLFESLMHGSLDPLMPAMGADTDFRERLENRIRVPVTDEGRYAITFLTPHHLKQQFYYRLLIPETLAYCNELISMMGAETSPEIRAYYRDLILDKHLSACLRRLAEKCEAAGLTRLLLSAGPGNQSIETVYNSYVLHLLKVCIAKAYLEIQECLSDVVRFKMTEAALYSTCLNEMPPVKTWLKMRPKPSQPKPAAPKEYPVASPPAEKVAAPVVPETKPSVMDQAFMSVKDIAAKTGWSERTVTRHLKAGELSGSKPRGTWLIAPKDFESFYNRYKNQATKNQEV